MTANGWLQFVALFTLLLLLMRPLGLYIARVLEGGKTFLDPLLRPVERLLYRACGIHADQEMSWQQYSIALLVFSFVSLLLTYIIERAQALLPWNPQHLAGVAPATAFNTAASFTTNTNWQVYTPEATMSYFTQMAGLAYHNFVSAAVGIAIAIALVRGIARKQSATIGNFWVDTTRTTLWILLPICLVVAPVLIGQGVIQNLKPYTTVSTLQHGSQIVAQGPVASQEVIKELGTNGGGFFNANSGHHFENPTPFSNFIEIELIFLIPAALTITLGKMTGSSGHGWAVFATMAILFFAGYAVCYWAESQPHPLLHGVDQKTTLINSGGNMEGKEVRFGVSQSALFATVTTDTSCGAVNSAHDSFMPLGGMVPLVNIMLGEVVFGGVGSGLYGMLVFVVLSVFIAGLMVGRTPEYLGKKIERREVQFAILAVLVTPVLCLVPTAIAAIVPAGLATLNNTGPHGFSEILYAFTSTNANNGSAFAGLGPNLFYNLMTGANMMFGRFAVAVPALALAGALAGKKSVPEGPGTFSTHSPIFVALLIGVIVIVGALTFLPADSLGPIVEHLLVLQGKTF